MTRVTYWLMVSVACAVFLHEARKSARSRIAAARLLPNG